MRDHVRLLSTSELDRLDRFYRCLNYLSLSFQRLTSHSSNESLRNKIRKSFKNFLIFTRQIDTPQRHRVGLHMSIALVDPRNRTEPQPAGLRSTARSGKKREIDLFLNVSNDAEHLLINGIHLTSF